MNYKNVDGIYTPRRGGCDRFHYCWLWVMLSVLLVTLLFIGLAHWVIGGRIINEPKAIMWNLEAIGSASWYGNANCDNPRCLTYYGEVFDEDELTCASNDLPYNTILKVVSVSSGKEVLCRVSDTGGFKKYNRILDLSKRAFEELGDTGHGVMMVKIYEQK